MTDSNKSISPLRQRMIDDMTLRKLNPKTQTGYIRAVKKLTCFLGRSPDTATAEDLRLFQLHLVELGVSSITLNATINPHSTTPALHLVQRSRGFLPRGLADACPLTSRPRVPSSRWAGIF